MDTVIDHINEFIKLIREGDEIKCIEYIDKHNDFYNTIMGIWSPLTYACNYEKYKVVYKLLDVGADINLSVAGWSPLMYASYLGNINLGTELLKRGANINYKNSRGSSALSVACVYGRLKFAAMLITAGADFIDLNFYNMYDLCHKNGPIMQSIRDVYRKRILAVIDDDTCNNAMAASFRTTYAIELVDMISEFII
ncbi:MAG: hypothetical protein Faunusvirus2_27 [Faunusvirus sp.]|jgi:ankyrin repeat protein|uniref:Uncharacterized protein n=1 Tax=Faunusvirus sp. TaxID=2487766 RepID=A0A3G4ZW50_9VIRU|nr:MAG: hypothetical protein Faunusvirus2_27 [Faunusvirus sp.]